MMQREDLTGGNVGLPDLDVVILKHQSAGDRPCFFSMLSHLRPSQMMSIGPDGEPGASFLSPGLNLRLVRCRPPNRLPARVPVPDYPRPPRHLASGRNRRRPNLSHKVPGRLV